MHATLPRRATAIACYSSFARQINHARHDLFVYALAKGMSGRQCLSSNALRCLRSLLMSQVECRPQPCKLPCIAISRCTTQLHSTTQLHITTQRVPVAFTQPMCTANVRKTAQKRNNKSLSRCPQPPFQHSAYCSCELIRARHLRGQRYDFWKRARAPRPPNLQCNTCVSASGHIDLPFTRRSKPWKCARSRHEECS